ncbi:hypothetical protein WJX82_010437 [Trebouxia sp. C0006]
MPTNQVPACSIERDLAFSLCLWLCGASAANSNCTEQTEPLLGAEGVASRVNRTDISSVDRPDVAAAPTLAVAGPQLDPKVIPLALPVSQSGSNNGPADVDDESPTSALFLQLEPAEHHTKQKQPSAQQASPNAEQNAASEDSLTQQPDFAASPVTDEQGQHQHNDTAPANAHVGQAPSSAEEQHGTEQPGGARLATTTGTTHTHKASGTMHVSAHDDKPLPPPSDTATHRPESSNKAHSNSKADGVSAEDGGSTGASPTAVLPDDHMATSPSFHGLAPAGRDGTQREDKHDGFGSKQSAMQGTQRDGSKQISSRIITPLAAANADSTREAPTADQDDTDGKGGAGLSVNGQGNGHQQKAEPVTEGDGPMFSGKTSELVKRVRRSMAASKKCLLIKYKGDTRYGPEPTLSTHNNVHMDAKSVLTLGEMENAAWHYDVIAIDEGQFFPDLVERAEQWANDGKHVFVSALDATFQRKPFLNVLEVIPLAENVIKLTAVCSDCHKSASFTKRLSAETDIQVVGGADKYTALCRTCFQKPDAHLNAQRGITDCAALPTSKRQPQKKSSRLAQENAQPNRRQSLEALSQPSNTTEAHVEQRRKSLQALSLR